MARKFFVLSLLHLHIVSTAIFCSGSSPVRHIFPVLKFIPSWPGMSYNLCLDWLPMAYPRAGKIQGTSQAPTIPWRHACASLFLGRNVWEPFLWPSDPKALPIHVPPTTASFHQIHPSKLWCRYKKARWVLDSNEYSTRSWAPKSIRETGQMLMGLGGKSEDSQLGGVGHFRLKLWLKKQLLNCSFLN